MLYLHGVGHFHPQNVIDNAFLESLDIGTDDAWILERVGIRSRRTVLSLDYIRETRNRDPRAAGEASTHTNAQTGAEAARVALARAGITPADVGMVIAGSCSPQWSIPAEACLIGAELGIEAPCFDVSSACSTFAAQLGFLHRCADIPDYVLIVQPENNTRTVDYNDRATAVLWGDGSAAAVLSTKHAAHARVSNVVLHSDPSGWQKVCIPSAGHFTQEGRAVQGFAIRKGAAALKEVREQSSRSPEQLFFVGHQANLLVLEGICRRAEVSEDRHLHNIQDFGNCGGAGAPSVLSQNWDRFENGSEVAVSVVGSGLTWGGALIEFEDV
ncbi:MAG: ketoacyl-ACP synthase III [Planctomycetota bacterium]